MTQRDDKYEYPNDLWTTIIDENNKLIDINLFSDGEDKSYDTCEICGNPGKTRGRGWISTQCDKCWGKSKLNR